MMYYALYLPQALSNIAKYLAKNRPFTPVPSTVFYIVMHINVNVTNFLFNLPLFVSYVDEVVFWEGLPLKLTVK